MNGLPRVAAALTSEAGQGSWCTAVCRCVARSGELAGEWSQAHSRCNGAGHVDALDFIGHDGGDAVDLTVELMHSVARSKFPERNNSASRINDESFLKSYKDLQRSRGSIPAKLRG